ncbi:DUF4062 domain-containing protein [Peribacillus kribbensis]|uniref:DUF4062 domain-containing protein n=1 Tax=Peribacillus kribbensis TaxID=356658 RepID=UPI0003F5ECF2|nr:DUF4062 domain-containing protein [Peribacillus kribbensis]
MQTGTKIFISSAYENELKPLRKKLMESLELAGHFPLAFEENFGVWGQDKIETCINKVKESDLFLLFISEKSGSFTERDPRVTATYVEFHYAKKEKKLILPFVNDWIKSIYFSDMKQLITEELYKFRSKFYRFPGHIYDIVEPLVKEIEQTREYLYRRIKDIDPFVWAFLYDVDQSCPFLYDIVLANADELCKTVNIYLSNYLHKGIEYLKNEDETRESLNLAPKLKKYKDYSFQLIRSFKNGVPDLQVILNELAQVLKGANIYNRKGYYVKEEIASFNDCTAISLYRRKGNKMVYVSHFGSITPKEEFSLTDEEAYVSKTYILNGEVEYLFFNEEKHQLYLTKRIGEMVLCAHFPFQEFWSSNEVAALQEEIFSAILKERIYLDFAADLIGGLDVEKE